MTRAEEVIAEIRTRGFWRLVVRPTRYDEVAVARNELEAILARSSVSLRGWDFPHISHREPVTREINGISQITRWEHYREYWKFFRSGQFIYLGGFADDWRDQSSLWPGTYSETHRRLGFINTICRLTEMFEFSARLALTEAGGPAIQIEVELAGLSHRQFYMDGRDRVPFHERPSMQEDRWATAWHGDRDELVSQRSTLAVEPLTDLFDLYGLDIQPEVIEYHQQRLLQGVR